MKFDHHCPWIGTCIGKRNYQYFIHFLINLAFYIGFLIALCITNLILDYQDIYEAELKVQETHIPIVNGPELFKETAKQYASCFILSVLAILGGIFVYVLLGLHLMLISKNLTT